jgi:hypothetical protein
MTGEFAAWARICLGAALLVIACLLRDVIVGRREAAAVNEAMRSRR